MGIKLCHNSKSYYYAQWTIGQQLQLKSAVPWPDMQITNIKGALLEIVIHNKPIKPPWSTEMI